MPELAVRKITKETLEHASSLEFHTEDELKANVDAINEACKEIKDFLHSEGMESVVSAFVRQGACPACLAMWGFKLGVACVNEQIQQDRLKAALAISE